MDIVELIEAGEKLGLRGAQLKAWAETQAERTRQERAQAHELQCKALIAQRDEVEAAIRRLELEREAWDAAICRKEFELNNFHQDLLVEETYLNGKAIGSCLDTQSRCLRLRSDVKCELQPIDTQVAADCSHDVRIEANHDFRCQPMLINEHSTSVETSSLEKESTESLVPDDGDNSSETDKFQAVTHTALFTNSDENTRMVQMMTTVTSSEQITCSKIKKRTDIHSRSLEGQLDRRAFRKPVSHDVERFQANRHELWIRMCKKKAGHSKRSVRHPHCGKKERKKRMFKITKRTKAFPPSRYYWETGGNQRGPNCRRYWIGLAFLGCTLWCDKAHRKFVRYKKTQFVLGQTIACAKGSKESDIFVVLTCTSRKLF
uniref:Uncharacterized protein n=1 Tax=Rhipicephalus appendiculatus TaxID=34631 RepID=A0A131YYW4_RHIAP